MVRYNTETTMNQFFLKRAIRRLHKSWKRTKCFKEYKHINRVLVLFDMENAEAVKDFVKSIQYTGKEVLAVSFFQGKLVEMPVVTDGFVLWHKEYLDYWGMPKAKELEDFKQFKPDTLIDLSIRPNYVVNYLSLITNAEYRVGFHLDEKSCGDLMIEYNPEQGFAFLTSQLHFYMKTLRTK